MKTFIFGVLTVLAGLALFMVGTFGSDFALLKSGWGHGLMGGAIPLRQYLIPSAYRFVFAALAAFLVIRLARGVTPGLIAVTIFGLLILLLEVAGQSELKDRVPTLWKIVSLTSLVAAIALGAAVAARSTWSGGPVR
jgi:hypothetical protein